MIRFSNLCIPLFHNTSTGGPPPPCGSHRDGPMPGSGTHVTCARRKAREGLGFPATVTHQVTGRLYPSRRFMSQRSQSMNGAAAVPQAAEGLQLLVYNLQVGRRRAGDLSHSHRTGRHYWAPACEVTPREVTGHVRDTLTAHQVSGASPCV